MLDDWPMAELYRPLEDMRLDDNRDDEAREDEAVLPDEAVERLLLDALDEEALLDPDEVLLDDARLLEDVRLEPEELLCVLLPDVEPDEKKEMLSDEADDTLVVEALDDALLLWLLDAEGELDDIDDDRDELLRLDDDDEEDDDVLLELDVLLVDDVDDELLFSDEPDAQEPLSDEPDAQLPELDVLLDEDELSLSEELPTE